MPTFDVTIEGKTYRVEIPDPGASPLQVIVDGQSFQVEVSGSEASAAPLVLAPAPRPAPTPAPLPPLSSVAVKRPVTPVGAEGGDDIVAPMPGTILSIAVQVGDPVEPGQIVCVLEAMKMKNPIRAGVSGAVAQIAVAAGQTVGYGELLVRLG